MSVGNYVDGWKPGFCDEGDTALQYFEHRLHGSFPTYKSNKSITIFRKDGWNARLNSSEPISENERVIAKNVDYNELRTIILKKFHINVPPEEIMLNA